MEDSQSQYVNIFISVACVTQHNGIIITTLETGCNAEITRYQKSVDIFRLCLYHKDLFTFLDFCSVELQSVHHFWGYEMSTSFQV